MPFNSNETEWNKTDTKPAQTKLDNGWSYDEKPPASIFNWFFNNVASAIKDLLGNAIHKDQKGVNNGVASLDSNGDVPTTQLPAATTAAQGAVILSTSTSDTSQAKAATPSAVKTAYDLANGRYAKPGAGIPKADLDTTTQDSLTPYVAAAGSANVYTATFSPAVAALKDGLTVRVKINLDNTAASTLNINGLGAKTIKKGNGGDVAAGNLKNGSIYTLAYNSTTSNFILQGEGGSGTAVATDVLTGKTFSNNTGDVTGSMANNGAVTITPGTANQTIVAGYHNGSGTVNGDADLISANIKSGANIFGVVGAANVIDTTQATGQATATDILTGKSAFVNGAAVNGSMADNGAVNILPGAANQTVAAGFHNGSGIVQGDVDLVTGNIKAGISIFGISGKAQVVDTTTAAGAAAGDILTGKTGFVNGSTIAGTMPNKGAVVITPSGSSQAIAAGYHSGSGSVAAVTFTAANVLTGTTIAGTVGTMPNKGAITLTPTTADQTIAAGYHNGSGKVVGDPDLVAANIAKDANIFGVQGTLERTTTTNKTDLITAINSSLGA